MRTQTRLDPNAALLAAWSHYNTSGCQCQAIYVTFWFQYLSSKCNICRLDINIDICYIDNIMGGCGAGALDQSKM